MTPSELVLTLKKIFGYLLSLSCWLHFGYTFLQNGHLPINKRIQPVGYIPLLVRVQMAIGIHRRLHMVVTQSLRD